MDKVKGRILKSNDVKLQGRFQLDMAHISIKGKKSQNSTLSAQQVRIVEKHSEFAVIEIICSCGTKIHVKCEYVKAEQTAAIEQTVATQ
ncbi:MAG: hypothetical protein ACYS9Y_09990 [Planctomycetota bacterium]|jgi:hypothetical protein